VTALRVTLCVVLAMAIGHTGAGAIDKAVYADYFGTHRTREHDGSIDSWFQSGEASESLAETTRFISNADLLNDDGTHQLASTVHPMVGMQSDLDPDYQEYQVLLAKAAHIDGFAVEWALPGIAQDETLRSLMKTAARYDFKVGVDWIEGCHFDWIPHHRPDCDTREEQLVAYRESVEYLLRDVYAAETGILADGHPLVFLFDGAAHEIAAGQYAVAAEALGQADTAIDGLEGRVVRNELRADFPGSMTAVRDPAEADGGYAANGLLLALPAEATDELAGGVYDGLLSFEYLDRGEGALTAWGVPAPRDPPDPKHAQICRIELTDTGEWTEATVKVHGANIILAGGGPMGADFAFAGPTAVRDIECRLTVSHAQ